MKPQTCCCHVCKTSLNQYKREYLPCTQCNKIVCRNCFGTKFRGSTWEDSNAHRETWACPSCTGMCTCPRCKNKKPTDRSNQLNGKLLSIATEEMKFTRQYTSPSSPPFIEKINPIGIEKLKPKVQKVVLAQLEELLTTERRCENNIKEMEKMLLIMKREKEEISLEREKLESMTKELDEDPDISLQFAVTAAED